MTGNLVITSSAAFWTGRCDLWGLSPFVHDNNLTCNQGTCPALLGLVSEIPDKCPSRKGPAEEAEKDDDFLPMTTGMGKNQ